MRKLLLGVLAAAAVVAAPPPAGAAPALALTVSTASITFPDQNPDLVPLIPATPSPVTITVRVTGNGTGNWRLTLAGNDVLRSGADTIPLANVSWTASGAPFQAGSLALTPGQTVASGARNANVTGTITFQLTNLWTYAPGNYTTTATFTLTAP